MKTLRQRLLTTLLVGLALTLMLFSTIVFLLARQTIRGEVDQFTRDKAFLIGAQVNPFFPKALAVDENPWHADRYIGFGQTFDAEWNLLYLSKRLSQPIAVTEQVKRLATHDVGVVHHEAVGPDGARYRMATVSIERQGKFVCYAQVGVLISERDAPLWQLLLWLAACAAGALLLAWLGLDFIIRQWGAPLAALGEAARQITIGDLARQRLFAPPDAPELVQLTASFNTLLDQLDSLHASQHQFVADASHELRTPLAALRAEIEVSLRRERTPADYRRTLQDSRHDLERLGSLVENLLALASLGINRSRPAQTQLDMCVVCRDVAEQLVTLAAQQNVRMELELPDSLNVPGDAMSIERAVRNLVENALRHTPGEEKIIIRVSTQSDSARIEVIDAGVGIAAEHMPHLFDRFYRVDTARTRTHGGAGLGLSIVQAIMKAHGGDVTVESKLGVGSTFTLRFAVR